MPRSTRRSALLGAVTAAACAVALTAPGALRADAALLGAGRPPPRSALCATSV